MANNTYTVTGNTVIDDTETLWGNRIQYNTLLYTGFQGVSYGYVYAGGDFGAPFSTVAERWPFASGSVSTENVNAVLTNRYVCADGISSQEYGYAACGDNGPALVNSIERYSYFSSSSGADVGDCSANKFQLAGNSSETHGYVAGGDIGASIINVIERWPFADSTTNATDVGDLAIGLGSNAGANSPEYGYSVGGRNQPGATHYNRIQTWPYASTTTNATDNADLTQAIAASGSVSGKEYGYRMGGGAAPSATAPYLGVNVIDRWPFATLTDNAADVGDLASVRRTVMGISNIVYGYSAGGIVANNPPFATSSTLIERWPYASTTTNATTVGDLTDGRRGGAGGQV